MSNKASPAHPSPPSDAKVPSTDFPYFQYTSLLCTHTILLAFTAVILPGSTILITPLPPQQSSLDKPQHRFLEPITASPVWTLLWLCTGTVACQAWWAGWMRQWWGTYPHGAKSSHTPKQPQGPAVSMAPLAEGKLQALANTWANTFFVSILFHAITVLFGAPIASHIPHTYLLSLLMSVLAVFVPSYTLSLPILSFLAPPKHETDLLWVSLFVERKLESPIERAFVFPVIGSFLGCWAGAFPIPLDWDRPWQAWPLTPAYGALAGHLLGSWFSLTANAVLFFASHGRSQGTLGETSASTKVSKKRNKKKGE